MAISLEKGKKVNLQKKQNAGLGEILVNLNWNSKPAKQGFFASLMGSKNSGGRHRPATTAGRQQAQGPAAGFQ